MYISKRENYSSNFFWSVLIYNILDVDKPPPLGIYNKQIGLGLENQMCMRGPIDFLVTSNMIIYLLVLDADYYDINKK